MIYMGKNPKLSSALSEFQFAISQFAGNYGGMEMWVDKFITRFLATGLLSLNLMGCVQTTDGVYSRQGDTWEESEGFFQNSTSYIEGVIASKVAGKYAFIVRNLTVFTTTDFITSEKNESLKNIHGANTNPVACTLFNGKVIVCTSTNTYYSEDYNTWTRITAINNTASTNLSCGVWKSKNALYVKHGSDFYITTDFVNWTKKTLTISVGDIYITDNYLRICTISSTNMDVIDTNFNLTTITNPFYTLSYTTPPKITTDNNNFVIASNTKTDIYSEDLSQKTEYTYSISGQIEEILFYNGKLFFVTTPNIEIAKLNCLDIKNSSDVYTFDFAIPYSYIGAGDLYLRENKGIISLICTDSPASLYVSFDSGITFNKIDITNINYYNTSVVPITELGIYYFGATKDSKQLLYTSKGREAGSGITSESLNSNNNYVQFSNGFKM